MKTEVALSRFLLTLTLVAAQTTFSQGQDGLRLSVTPSVKVQFVASPNTIYQAMVANQLGATPSWKAVGDPVSGVDGNVTFFYDVPSSQEVYFKIDQRPGSGGTSQPAVLSLELKEALDNITHLRFYATSPGGGVPTNSPLRNFKGQNLGTIQFPNDVRGIDCTEGVLSKVRILGSVYDCNFTRASFDGITITGAMFSSCRLIGASFRGSRLQLKKGETGYRDIGSFNACLLDQANFVNAWAPGWTFLQCSMVGCDFSNAVLPGVDFSTNTDLSGAIFSTALMDGAYFLYGTKAPGANFQNSQAVGTFFNGADLRRADFTGANLSKSDFSGANLDLAVLDFSDMNQAKFDAKTVISKKWLLVSQIQTDSAVNAKLDDSNFARATFKGKSFSGASLRGTLFKDADLTNTDFSRADLSFCDLTGARGFDSSKTGTVFNKTTMPDGSILTRVNP